MARPEAITGARAILMVETLNSPLEVVAFATSVSYTFTNNYRELYTVDESLPVELVPEKISVDITCGVVRTITNTPRNSTLEYPNAANLDTPYFRVLLLDRKTGKTIFEVTRALLISRRGSVNARGLMTETWTLKGIGYHDTVTDFIPKPRLPA